MSPNDYYQKYLEDADLSELEKKGMNLVLSKLIENPGGVGRVEAPAGYENFLVASVMQKIARIEKPFYVRAKEFLAESLRVPQFSWSVAGTFAALTLVISVSYFSQVHHGAQEAERKDLLASTAKKADHETVNEWLAVMGDSSARVRFANRDIQSLARNLASDTNSEHVEAALNEVAAAFGKDL